jgi:predicted ArsR family transcriptional regulator
MTATIQFKGSGYVFTTVGTLEQKLKDERDRLARERDAMTSGQRDVLGDLNHSPKTANEVAHIEGITDDAARQRLRRLEDRGLVRRITDPPARWELTHAGRSALQLTT